MASLPERSLSYWIDTTPTTGHPPLQGDVEVDVAVVGGGLVGLTTALLLKRAGRRVAVLESRRVAEGVTGHTTAKVTSQHGLIYAQLIDRFGEDTARVYAEANQTAIERIAEIAAGLGIDCDFERKAAYTYTRAGNAKQIEAEADAAARVGLPAAFVRETSLPYPVAGAVRFDNQAQFHPRKYLLPVAEAIAGDGSFVHEETRVLDVDDGSPCRVATDKGAVTAGDVIVATNIPILDRGGFFARAFPRAHLVIAAEIDDARAPDGMFLSADTPSHSLRVSRHDGKTWLIVVGASFKPGQLTDTEGEYRKLAEFVRAHFEIGPIGYRWMNQDYNPMDQLPYIGKLTPASKHVYVATGFKAWGITNGTAAAMILSDAVLGKKNPWAATFDTSRVNPSASAKSFMGENLHVAKHWIKDRLHKPSDIPLASLKPGEAAVVMVDGKKVGAYRDGEGVVHAVSAICTHMGCELAWNNAEQSWDCACHGSRFDRDGRKMFGPAIRDLARH